VSRIQVSTLSNGLRVATDPMDAVETLSVGAWIETGSRYESPKINGISHLLEHMVFKGTRKRDARAIAEEIEAVGGHLNAHTSREYTAFYAKVLKEDARLAVDIISDMVQNATLDAEELDRERTVVMQEIMQALDTPDDVVFDRFQERAFPDQSLGRSVLGATDLIRDMDREQLCQYMGDRYQAKHMVLAAAGRIDHKALVDLAEEAFSELPSGSDFGYEPARYKGGDWRDQRDLEQVHVILGFEGLGYRDPDFYAVSVLSTLFGGGMSSRLFQEVREKRGLVYSIYSFPAAYVDSGLFGIYAGTGQQEVAELIPIVCEEISKVSAHVQEEEVARARAQLKSSILMSLESTTSRCEQLARQLMVFGRPMTVPEIVEKVEAVDADSVTRVAKQLVSTQPTVAALGPLGKLESYESVLERLA